ncbi:conserved hypothetical protein [Paenibacillus sp. JDR-2]|nr:conserved hypothetical protein [Paenibacillus sp. JDR-2]
MRVDSKFEQYEGFIRALPLKTCYRPNDLLVPELFMQREGPIEMYYAPHNDYGNPQASIMIVGITPGWTQMEVAIRTANQSMFMNKSVQEICKEAKMAARFAGSMRNNLIQMLNELNLPAFCGIADSKELFEEECPLLHTTSLLRYPVFINKKNYNGHSPELSKNAFLRNFAYQSIMSELQTLNNAPLIIPLGKTVEKMFSLLLTENKIKEKQILWGFPHPSGANGHRLKQFEQSRKQMLEIIRNYVSLKIS